MRRALALTSSLLLTACHDAPAEPETPWILGRWAFVDSVVVDYAYDSYPGVSGRVAFSIVHARDATVDLTRLGGDSVTAAFRGSFRAVTRSTGATERDERNDLEFSTRIRVTPSFVYGFTLGYAEDSLPVPATRVTRIDWDADTMVVCRSWRQSVGPDVVPGSFACRHRIHWRRP